MIKDQDEQIRLCCKTCIEFKDKLKLGNALAHEGSPSIHISSLSRHNESNEHKGACRTSEKVKSLELSSHSFT